MIRIAEEKDKEMILEVMKKNMVENIYLYIDILIYGLNNENLKVWINMEEFTIKQIVLKYYNSFQIYSNIGSYSDIVNLIFKYKPMMISGTKDIIKEIHRNVKGYYNVSYGIVLEQEQSQLLNIKELPTRALLDDMEKIADLICSDKNIGGHYSKATLNHQLSERLQDKMGRNYIIKKEEKIVAHYATYAETVDVAVMGGLIVDSSSRGKGYARILHKYLANELLNEEKRVFLFCDEELVKMYLTLGAKVCGEYGKLTLASRKKE